MQLLIIYQAYQKQLYADFVINWSTNEPIFTSNVASLMRPGQLSDWTSKMLHSIGYPDLFLKDLQHLSVTLLALKNTPIKNISARAGHARSSTTLDMYTHVIKGADDTSAAAMDEVFTEAGFGELLDKFTKQPTQKNTP